MTARIDQAADALLRAQESKERFQPFAAAHAVASLADAYAVQDALVERLRRNGAKPVGYKVGLTSPRMQAMCRIDQPIAGVVLSGRVHSSGSSIKLADFVHVGLEFEVGIRMGRDLPPGKEPFNRADVARAVEAVCPAFELIEDRGADYKKLDVLELVAENSWNGGIVLGESRSAWPDLAAIGGVVELNGTRIDQGQGRDVLGHPFEPLAWLANHLGGRGGMLRAGDVVLTGSMAPTRFPKAGDCFRFTLAGLGSVAAVFAA
jgi:2-keto-4-pentenoate hydratase